MQLIVSILIKDEEASSEWDGRSLIINGVDTNTVVLK